MRSYHSVVHDMSQERVHCKIGTNVGHWQHILASRWWLQLP